MVDAFRMLSDGARTAESLRIAASLVTYRLDKTVKLHGSALLRQVKANASGRPGPRVQTGDYRRSINLRLSRTVVSWAGRGAIAATVGTNSPQGRRLEYGFMDMTDSLGRLFHQPPYPHFGPALAFIAPRFEAAVRADVAAILATVSSMNPAVTGEVKDTP